MVRAKLELFAGMAGPGKARPSLRKSPMRMGHAREEFCEGQGVLDEARLRSRQHRRPDLRIASASGWRRAASGCLRRRCPAPAATDRSSRDCSISCARTMWSSSPGSTGWHARPATCLRSPRPSAPRTPACDPRRALGRHHLTRGPDGADRVRRSPSSSASSSGCGRTRVAKLPRSAA